MNLYLFKNKMRGVDIEVLSTAGTDDVVVGAELIAEGVPKSTFEVRLRKKLSVKKVCGLTDFRVSMYPQVSKVCLQLQDMGLEAKKIQYRVQEVRVGGKLTGVEGLVVLNVQRPDANEVIRQLSITLRR